MTAKREKDDNSLIEFIATKREDETCYTLTVSCKDGLSEQEFADCLVSFASDIDSGEFKFTQEVGSTEGVVQ